MRRGMKFLIASDIHGSAYYCEQLLQAFEREQAARLLLLGDILYHGPRNDLPRDYAPKKVIAMLNGMADIILCVRGNCDTRWTRWCSRSQSSRTMPSCRQGSGWCMSRTGISSIPRHRRRCVRAMCCCTDYAYSGMGAVWQGKSCI